jgi:hypothetical protein
MRIIIARNDAAIANKVVEEKSRFDSYALTATPELADRLGKAVTAYNWVNPGIVAAHVLTGNDAVLAQTATKIGEQAFKAGITPTSNRPSRISAQERAAATQRAIAKANAASVTRPVVAPTSRTTPPKEDDSRGFWGNVTHYTGLQQAFDWITPESVEDVVGDVTGAAYSGIKGLATGFTMGAMFAPQIIQNEIFALANQLPSGHSFKTQKNKSLFDQFVVGPIAQQTYFGQFINQSIKGIASDEKVTTKDIVGTGFFPGGAVVEKQAEAAKAYRPLIGEQELPMTLGRAGGQIFSDVGVIEEGTVPYNLISGTLDAFFALKLDPSFGRNVGKRPFGSGGKAASAVPERDAIRAAAGLVEEGRPSVVPSLWNQWKTTPKAVEVLKLFVDETNPAQVWRNLGRQGLMSADEIAAATDHSSVVGALDNAVNNLEPGFNIRNTPSGKFESVSDLGYKIKQSSQRFTNVFEVMPETTFIPNSDPQIAATRLDDLMGYLGFGLEERNTWINRFIEVNKEGTSEAFFNFLTDWEGNLLKPALLKNLVPESEIPRLTRWRLQTLDQATRFTLQDIQDGVPAAWMNAGGYGPVRNTQLLQDGAYIVDPTILDEVANSLGKLYKIEQQAQKLPKPIRGPINVAVGGADFLSDAYGFYQRELWKPIVVAAARYLTRVLPDEQARVLLNGTFEHPGHYLAAILDGRFAAKLGQDGMYVADVFGDPVNKAKLAVELEHKLIAYRQVEDEIKRLRSLGIEAALEEADEIAFSYADELAEIPDLVVQLERTERILNDSVGTLNDALIGAVPGKAKQRIINLYEDGSYIKTGSLNIVSKNIAKELPSWTKGVVQEVADLYNNPHIRRIANADLFDKDVLTIEGVTSTWVEHLSAGRLLDSNEAIAQWLHTGSGRQYFEKYFTNFAGIPEGYQWDSIENSREFVRVLNSEVSSIAGTNETMLKAIATGAYEGKPAFTKDVHNIVSGEDSFTQFVGNQFAGDASAPTHIRYRSTARVGSKGIGSKAVARWDWLLNSFFSGAYGLSSDKLSRSPAFRAGYWGRVEEVATLASPKAAEELLANLEKANLPRPQADRIRRLLKLSDGSNDLEAVDATARNFGLNYERNLLFDASKKSAFGNHHKYLFPFFEAYREQGSTWLKLLVERPQNAHKIDVAIRALREADGIGLGDANGDGKKDGFLYKDPQTGEERLVVPGSSWLGTTFAGVPFGGFSLPSGSLTMVSQVLPGIGPAVQFPAQFFVPTTKSWQWVNNLLFPYGRPEETGASPVGGFVEGAIPKPTWLKRIAPYISDEFKDLPVVGGTFGELMGDSINYFAGKPKESQVWQSYYLRTLQSLSSTRPTPKTQREAEALLADAEEKTNKLYFLRGLGNFVLPGTPVSKFMAETKEGPVELGVLADEMRRYEQEAEDAGQNRNEGSLRFIEVYGDTVWSVFGSLRRSDKYEGLVMSKEFEDWFSSNQKLINTYPQVASFFGPQTEPGKFGPTEQSVYNRFVAKDIIKAQTGNELITQAQTNVAFTFLDSVRSQMSVAQQNSEQGKAILASTREALKNAFPKWDIGLAGQESVSKRENQIKQLREIITEPKIKDTNLGVTVSSYLSYRDQQIENLLKQGVKGWQKGNKSVNMRSTLQAVGDGFAQVVPEFKPLWERVLSREFELPIETGQ